MILFLRLESRSKFMCMQGCRYYSGAAWHDDPCSMPCSARACETRSRKSTRRFQSFHTAKQTLAGASTSTAAMWWHLAPGSWEKLMYSEGVKPLIFCRGPLGGSRGGGADAAGDDEALLSSASVLAMADLCVRRLQINVCEAPVEQTNRGRRKPR